MPEPPRLNSGYRLYPNSAVRRVRFIKRAQEIGFSGVALILDIDLKLREQPSVEDEVSIL